MNFQTIWIPKGILTKFLSEESWSYLKRPARRNCRRMYRSQNFQHLVSIWISNYTLGEIFWSNKMLVLGQPPGHSGQNKFSQLAQWAEIMVQEDIDYFPEFFGKIETKNTF